MTRKIIALSAKVGDTIYYGYKRTGATYEFLVHHILITEKENNTIIEYYNKYNQYICTENDLLKIKLIEDEIYCTHEALRNAYMNNERNDII